MISRRPSNWLFQDRAHHIEYIYMCINMHIICPHIPSLFRERIPISISGINYLSPTSTCSRTYTSYLTYFIKYAPLICKMEKYRNMEGSNVLCPTWISIMHQNSQEYSRIWSGNFAAWTTSRSNIINEFNSVQLSESLNRTQSQQTG